MELPDQLYCLFSSTVEERDDSYVIKVPKQEIKFGALQDGETHRVAILPSPTGQGTEQTNTGLRREPDPPKPPVEQGDQRTVEIEDIGDQGDGITRVERGFVVIIPETEKGERLTVEITDVRENVAFAEVVERLNSNE
ncbi:TRAM domain-containing protein [Halosimplex pelagicum]|uniref:TRAM domain-containing protein n=1 Tax=Halosimplex pelagicum TaxID=869886 RepID=A0A7D5PAU8_9EURY|nr:TRAM domain-containing protein [Halosimplex pelagicum]QLH85066.1 TRAM domain-containing protein [Halosimplex pelagicum]